MNKRHVRTVKIAGAAMLAAGSIHAALAAHVVLTPTTGGIDFEGDLKSYDGSSYVLETPVGTMRLPASGFICKSGECPEGTRNSTTTVKATVGPARPDYFRIYGATSLGEDLVPGFIRAFGVSRGELTEEVFLAQSLESHFFLYKNRETPTIEVDIQRYGTAHGLRALSTGETTISMAARGILPEEEAALPPASSDRTERYSAYVIALDAVAIAVSPKRDIQSLTLTQMADIFSGRISDWSELKLEPGRINVYAPSAGNGILDIFSDTILKPRGLVMSPLAVRMDDFSRISDKVTTDKNAIAMISMAFRRDAKLVPLADTCGIVTEPSPFTVKTEEYPMAHRSYLYTAGIIPKVAADFIAFTQSPEAQTTVADKQFVNQAIALGPRSDETPRITKVGGAKQASAEATLARRLVANLAGARRLSITFRFQNGTSAVDERARQDLRRVVEWMNAPQNASATIVVAGFTDQLGSFSANTALSQQRAEQIRQSLLRQSPALRPERIEGRGFGPLAPVACNTEAGGRQLNRRVEVWVKG